MSTAVTRRSPWMLSRSICGRDRGRDGCWYLDKGCNILDVFIWIFSATWAKITPRRFQSSCVELMLESTFDSITNTHPHKYQDVDVVLGNRESRSGILDRPIATDRAKVFSRQNVLTRIALAISFGVCEISPFLIFFIEFLQTNVDLFITTVLSLPIFNSLCSAIKKSDLIRVWYRLFSFLVIELILKVFFLVLPTFSLGFANSVAN